MIQSVLDRSSVALIEQLSALTLESIVTFHIESYDSRYDICNAKMLIEDAGSAAASVIASEIHDALEAHGIFFQRSGTDYRFPELIYRAELIPEEKKITVFSPALEELSALIEQMPVLHSLQGREEEMVLSHELSHYLQNLEYRRSEEPHLFKEVRAHLFTMRYLSLSVYPWICDVIQLLHRNPQLINRFHTDISQTHSSESKAGKDNTDGDFVTQICNSYINRKASV